MNAIYRKELRQYFSGMLGYLFIAFILLLVGILASIVNFRGLYPDFESTLSTLSYIFLLVIPLLTMRTVAEEKRQKTDQLLYSLPLPVSGIVLGKFFAMVTVFLIPVAVMSVYPLLMSLYGTVALATTYTAIFGFTLFGISLITIGLFTSSLTENPVIAAVLCFTATLVMYLMSALKTLVPGDAFSSFLCFSALIVLLALLCYFMTKSYTAALGGGFLCEIALIGLYSVKPSMFEDAFAAFLDWFSVYDRFINFLYGIFDIRSTVYYLTFIAVLLFFTVQSVEKKRWA